MTAEQFVYWLQGYMEINDPQTISKTETQIIKDHLKLVFDKQTPDRSNMTEIVGVPNSTQPIQPYVSPNDWSFNPKPYNPYTITCTDSDGHYIQANDPNKKIC